MNLLLSLLFMLIWCWNVFYLVRIFLLFGISLYKFGYNLKASMEYLIDQNIKNLLFKLILGLLVGFIYVLFLIEFLDIKPIYIG